ncbi:hypothetical protein RYX36_012561, partial [Vicia faba]
LNSIRTRLSPLRHSSSAGAPAFAIKEAAIPVSINNVTKSRSKSSHPRDLGEKVHWNQSKSFKAHHSHLLPVPEINHAAFAEIQSPRFQEILRLTSRRHKRNPDIKSFSHELNSKGVRPYPTWKHRASWHVE